MLNTYSKLTRIIILVALVVSFCSCGKRDYSKEVHHIDSLEVALQDVSNRYNELDIPRLSAQFDSVNRHLEYVQKNYVGYQREDMAKVFSAYRQVKKLIPDLASAQAKIKTEITTDLEQLSNLKLAMLEGASHDAAGNKITEEYLDKAFREETKAASALIDQLQQLMQRAPRADSIYTANYDKVRFWVDSIPPLPVKPLQTPK